MLWKLKPFCTNNKNLEVSTFNLNQSASTKRVELWHFSFTYCKNLLGNAFNEWIYRGKRTEENWLEHHSVVMNLCHWYQYYVVPPLGNINLVLHIQIKSQLTNEAPTVSSVAHRKTRQSPWNRMSLHAWCSMNVTCVPMGKRPWFKAEANLQLRAISRV